MGKWLMIQKRIKMIIDVLMTFLLLFLMASQVTGDKYHEWIGAGMLLLFLLHNGLNGKWYKAIFKGKYSAQRVLRTIVNLAVLAAIILTGYSGVVLSRHLFAFLPIEGGMATARRLHLSCSYWSFVLMSIHLGMHWSVVIGKMKMNTTVSWMIRTAGIALALYGAILFGQNEIFHNMFLQNEFTILDYETSAVYVILQNLAMMSTWIFVGHYLTQTALKFSAYRKDTDIKEIRMHISQAIVSYMMALAVILCSAFFTPAVQSEQSWQNTTNGEQMSVEKGTDTDESVEKEIMASENFVLIKGGTFYMGSPETENWRSQDEQQHTVSVSDFYMGAYELTQKEYADVTGSNPSTFTGDELPVENVTWLEAVTYCNLRSEQEGLTPVYQIEGESASWNLGADGYRLPTEAEWEYACKAGTETPFNTETSISAEEANYYGHYPYEIEENYFEQGNLTTKPGEYRETTVAVDSFAPNAWGLYNMHGNVSEWVWDYYGSYDTEESTDPTGPATGTLRIYRGGGWNDFAKNMRSAYRATLEPDKGSFNIGIRLVRNAVSGSEHIIGTVNTDQNKDTGADGKVLIAFFFWGGNTKGVAEGIQKQTGADLFEITLVEPHSNDYNTVLDQAQHDQNIQARPEITEHIDNMDEYDTILIGYPNWWYSAPMPVFSFLEENDLSDKRVVLFCSHGTGGLASSVKDISAVLPDSQVESNVLGVYRDDIPQSKEMIRNWLDEIGYYSGLQK
ncbi:MAG: flavodoxin [Lachnospiraceae bacterium]|nr:flavodoxin [Lachnospiraceae bacterium]